MTQSTTCVARAASARVKLLAVLFSLFGILPAAAQQSMEISEQDGLVSVKASNASAGQLAEALSEQLGFPVVIAGDSETQVNIDIVDEPLDSALNLISPNNMLIRAGKAADSEILEVVLMMGEGAPAAATAGSEQFLPSGAPAEDVAASDPQGAAPSGAAQSADGGVLRDPNRSEDARAAATAAASDAGVPPDGKAVDPVTGAPIDPTTGQPLNQ